MSIEKIIARVQKLLAVSRSENEHEAALAASKAAALMAEYQLSEAMLRVSDASRVAESIVDGVKLVDQTKKRTAWREAIAMAVAESLGAKMYLWNGVVTCFGREGATQAWNYTCQYLFREIDRLADEAWEREGADAEEAGHSIRRWKNAFRVGAAMAVSARLTEAAKAAKEERSAWAEDARSHGVTSNDDLALMIVERDEHEVESAYSARARGFRTLGSIGTTSSRTGYNAGKEAGGRVALGGGRAALGAGQGRLR